MARLRSGKTATSKPKGINRSTRTVASPSVNATFTNDENIVPENVNRATKNRTPNPAPTTPVNENPAATIESPIDNPGLVIASVASPCDKDFAIDNLATMNTTSTATVSLIVDNPSPVIDNPSPIANAASPCDEDSVTENPATIDTPFTCDTGNTGEKNSAAPTSDIGVIVTDKIASSSNEASPTEPTTNNVISSIDQGYASAHNSSAASSVHDMDTALECGDLQSLVQDGDAPFEFDDESPLEPSVPAKSGNAQPVAQSKTRKTDRRSKRRPKKRGSESFITKPNSPDNAIIIDDEPVDNGSDKSAVDGSDDVPIFYSTKQVLQYRQRHVEKMKSSLDNLIAYIESTAASDQSADWDGMKGGWKYSFTDFITTELDDSDQSKLFANDILDQIREYQGMLRRTKRFQERS